MPLFFEHPLRTLARALSVPLLLGIAEAAAATPYRFDELPIAPIAGVFTPRDVNDAGLVVGGYNDGTGVRHQGFLFQDGAYTTLLGNVSTLWIEPRGVNDAGLVTGYYTSQVLSSYSTGFVLDHGVLTHFNGVAPWGTDVGGINNQGQIVGTNPEGFFGVGFIYTVGTQQRTRLDDINLLPADINDHGALVGRQNYFITGEDGSITPSVRAAIYDDGNYRFIGLPGVQEDQVQPYGINNAGTVSGSFVDALGSHGFVIDGGQVSVLDAPGAVAGTTQVYGINNRGQVAGYFMDADGATHGFVATPVPEPMSAALMLAGLASVGLGLRLRGRGQVSTSSAQRS